MHRICGPETPVLESLIFELRRSTDCLFTVAYLDEAVLSKIEYEIEEQLKRPRFRLRILFRASDAFVDPEAIERLRQLGLRRAGRLEVQYSSTRKFHAKAFGFKMTKSAGPTVILGSANLTGAAMDFDSGELGVQLAPGPVANGAWSAMERFWSEGRAVTPQWLRTYERAYKRIRRGRKPADQDCEKWKKRFKGPRQSPTGKHDFGAESLFIEHVKPLSDDERAEVEEALKKRGVEDLQTPDRWTCYEYRKDARAVPRQSNILIFQWRTTNVADGLEEVSISRLQEGPIPLRTRSGERLWLLYFAHIRGRRVRLLKKDHARHTRALKTSGLSWTMLERTPQIPRGRKASLLEFVRRLGVKLS